MKTIVRTREEGMKKLLMLALTLVVGATFAQDNYLTLDYGIARVPTHNTGLQGTVSVTRFFEENTGLSGHIGMYGYDNVDYTWVGFSGLYTMFDRHLWLQAGANTSLNDIGAIYPHAGAKAFFLKSQNWELGLQFRATRRYWQNEFSYGLTLNVILP